MRPPPFSSLYEPGGCVRQGVCQKPRGQDSFPLLALFLGNRRSHGQGSWLVVLVQMFLRELSRAVAWPSCI